MSFYYKQNFVSPEPIFYLVKEEMKGYMESGAVDDVLFPTWTNFCLNRLGKASWPINQAMLCTNNFESRLPDDFHAMREAWACSEYESSYQLPSAMYTEIKEVSTRIDSPDMYCQLCDNCQFPDIIQAIYKTTQTVAFQWRRNYLLTPGNTYPACPTDLYCANYNSIAENSYDVRDNKFVTSFREGKVYIQYYSKQFDASNQLVPDNTYIQTYIELYIKQKLFEQLKNQATDESRGVLDREYERYKAMAAEAYILADSYNIKEDPYRKQRAIRRTQNRFRRFDIR